MTWKKLKQFNCDSGLNHALPRVYPHLVMQGNRFGIKDIVGEVSKWRADQEGEGEGVVIELNTGIRWKVKSLDYLRLHKLLTRLSFKNILTLVRDGKSNASIIDNTPEYYKPTVCEILQNIHTTVEQVKRRVNDAWVNAPQLTDRKTYAEWVFKQPVNSCYLFAKFDRRELTPLILKTEFKDRENKGVFAMEERWSNVHPAVSSNGDKGAVT